MKLKVLLGSYRVMARCVVFKMFVGFVFHMFVLGNVVRTSTGFLPSSEVLLIFFNVLFFEDTYFFTFHLRFQRFSLEEPAV